MLCSSPASSGSDMLGMDLMSRLVGIEKTGSQLQLLGNFFSYLPSRLGYNPALDASLKCLLSVHQSLLGLNRHCFEEDLRSYNQAVSLIREDLRSFQKRVPSETVCAAMILLSCEVGFDAQW